MEQHELDKLFDQQAAGYDAQWARMAPIRESLHFLLETVFADLPEDARLRKGGMLAWADLAWDTNPPDYPDMLRLRMRTMSGAGLDDDAIERMRVNYARDVAILPSERVATLVGDAGFEAPLRFHQAGMIHGWCARRE